MRIVMVMSSFAAPAGDAPRQQQPFHGRDRERMSPGHDTSGTRRAVVSVCPGEDESLLGELFQQGSGDLGRRCLGALEAYQAKPALRAEIV